MIPFVPGQSGNPGGSYKSRPFTAAIAQVSELTVEELKISSKDKAPIAVVKSLFREGIKGKVLAATELADRFATTGRPTAWRGDRGARPAADP